MNKKLIKFQIIIWCIIVVFFTGVLGYVIFYNKDLSNSFNINNIVNISIGGKTLKLQKNQSIDLQGCNNINLEFKSSDIIIKETNGSKLKVVQKSTSKLKEKEKFKIIKKGNDISVENGITLPSIGIIVFGSKREIIEVYIPKDYNKNLNINLTSGDLKFDSNISLNNIKSNQTSGDFFGNYNIKANEFNLESTSGDVEIQNLNTSFYNMEVTSGDINTRLLKGFGSVESTSGDIEIQYDNISDYSNIKASSGDVDLKINEKINFDFHGKCSSGDIESNFPINYNDNERKNEGHVKIGNESYKKINVKTSSGDINLKRIP